MSASRKQEGLIFRLQENGAPVPCDDEGDPDYSMLDSVSNADQYIKRYNHYYHSVNVSQFFTHQNPKG